MTASLHKLTAGDGYTYLTRQVAVADATTLGRSGLADYYSEKGERPGQWVGKGLDGLPGVERGQIVTEDQMRALYGEGLHPDAEAIQQDLVSKGVGRAKREAAIRLGQKYPELAASPLSVEVAKAFQAWNLERGNKADAAIPEADRALLRTQVARQMFEKTHGRAPLDERELTGFVAKEGRKDRQAVAGYDMTFSPVKSVSALWAVADRAIAGQIVAAHEEAVNSALEFIEAEALYTRRGVAGVRQVDTRGLVATRFLHRDTRSGDPDLHTHVAIANKVQDASDGAWLSVDGRSIFAATVAASERYNSALEAALNRRLGLRFEAREEDQLGRKRVVREVAGVNPELLAEWSSRAAMIDHRTQELAAEFKASHGRIPSPVEMLSLRQQANLETREAKHEPRSEEDQREQWRSQAAALLGGDDEVDAMVEAVHVRCEVSTRRLTDQEMEDVAHAAIERVEQDRARWRYTHLRAEVERRVKALNVAPEHQQQTVDAVLTTAFDTDRVVRAGVPDSVREPAVLTRKDGQSVYTVAHTQLFTTQETLAAEAAIVEAARRRNGRKLTDLDVEIALLESAANGVELNAGQRELVLQMATSGADVQLALAPAGSGKTTAMRVLSRAWEANEGTVIGLAPSAAAASELHDSIGAEADTLAQLTTRLQRGSALPEWADRITDRTLVVIDEAGMASTQDLHVTIEYVTSRGGSVRLIGDDQQLASVAAGGVLRDIDSEVGAVNLTRLMRFRDDAEAAATLALREGNAEALGFYLDRERVHVTADGGAIDAGFAAWCADREAERDAVMLAYTRDDVSQLNHRARAWRLAQLGGETQTATARLASGVEASEGDTIITRRNDRTLRASSTDWVKNGDRWTVAEVEQGGAVLAKHLTSGRLVRLPEQYVREYVDLGYATTIHAAQGSTVDTAHVVLSGQEDRQMLYVAMSRGREASHLYLAAGTEGDPHQVTTPGYVAPQSPTEILEAIIGRDGSQTSARTEMRTAASPATQLARIAPIYDDAVPTLATKLLTPARRDEITTRANQIVAEFWATHHDLETQPAPVLSDDPAWETLLGHLATIELRGDDSLDALTEAVHSRELDTAERIAAVLDWRVDSSMRHGAGTGPLPWQSGIPSALTKHVEYGPYLKARASQVTNYAAQLRSEYEQMPTDQLPEWARPFADDRDLVATLAIWRTAQQIPDTDLSPTGPASPFARLRRYQKSLDARTTEALMGTVAYDPRWTALVTDLGLEKLQHDPYWPTVARRLSAASDAGTDVATLLTDAIVGQRPLPDDHQAAALWFRLAPHMDLNVQGTGHFRPDWADALVSAVGDNAYRDIAQSTLWPHVIDTVNAAVAAHHVTAEQLIRDAGALLSPEGHNPQDLAVALTWRIEQITDASHTGDQPAPIDPADLETTGSDEDCAWLVRARVAERTANRHPDPIPTPADEPSAEDRAFLDELLQERAAQTVAIATPLDGGLEEPPLDIEDLPLDAHQGLSLPETRAIPAEYVPAAGSDELPPDPLNPAPEAEQAEQGATTSRERIVELNNLAASYYQQQYADSPAAGYIAGRFGSDLSEVDGLVIGYAPAGCAPLANWLASEHDASDSELVDAGLAKWGRRGHLVDVLRDRVVIGLHNDQDQLVGFIGRAAPGSDTSVPKYLNTPETAVFRKGAVLFGAHEAHDALQAGATPARAEGPFDAIALTLAGEGHVVGVAPLGTALTEAQADMLARMSTTGQILQATDTDKAGLSAAAKDFWKLTERGLNPQRLVLTDRTQPERTLKDPAEAWLHDPETLRLTLAHLDLSPSLASTLIAQRITDDRRHLEERNLHAIVAAARDCATIVAALPPEQWEEHVMVVAAQLPSPDAPALVAHEVLQATEKTVAVPRPDPEDKKQTAPAERPARGRTSREERRAAAQARAEERQKALDRLQAIANTLDQIAPAQRTPSAGDPARASQLAPTVERAPEVPER